VVSAVKLDIVTCGWELPGWEREFYPADLPADWRLTYFANEFPAVMLSAALCLRANEELLAEWAEAVPDGFRFYLEESVSAAGRRDLGPARLLLGDKLGGVVQDARRGGSFTSGVVARFQIPGEQEGRTDAGCHPAWPVPPACVSDLRAGRAWLEHCAEQTLGGPGLLLLDGAGVGARDLRRWWHLVWLLGLA